MTQPTTFVSEAERAIYRAYDMQRRLRLAGSIARVMLVLTGGLLILLLLGYLLPIPTPLSWEHERGRFVFMNVLLLCGLLFCFSTALFGEWLRNSELATGAITGAFLFSSLMFIALWGRGGLTPFALIGITLLLIPIAVAGLLRNTTSVISATAIAVVFTIGYLLLVKPEAQFVALSSLVPLLLIIEIIPQITMMFLMLAATGSYRETLNELGDVRLAFERAQQLDDLKDQFIASVNHELRNPIMTLQAYLDLLQSEDALLTAEHRQQLLARATRVGDSLVALLESILDVRRIDQETKNFALEAVTIESAVATALSLIDPREGSLENREVHIDIPPDLAVWAETVRLQQILTNLIANAIKYSAEGTPIEIKAQTVMESVSHEHMWWRNVTTQHAMVEITVRDYGLGIPPDQMPLLFQRFVRLPRDLNSTIVGNGLGLYLCRVLTQALRGKIWVESSGVAGEGSTFYLHFLPPPAGVLPLTDTVPQTATAHERSQIQVGAHELRDDFA